MLVTVRGEDMSDRYLSNKRNTLTPSSTLKNNPSRAVQHFKHHPIVHLQRWVGNRAVQRMLNGNHIQRYEIEGPFAKNDPVHEVLTLRALKDAMARIAREGKKKGDLLKDARPNEFDAAPDWYWHGHNIAPEVTNPSVHQFLRGVVWPDDPKGYLFDDEKDMKNYSSGTMWYEEFDADEKDEPEELIARSHYGDLQYFHGMATKEGEDPAETKARIMVWSKFLTQVANGSIDPDTKIGDVAEMKGLFSAHTEKTIKEIFGYGKGTDIEIRQRATGALMHLVQDSNALGHTERDEKGQIKEFHSYEHQDHGKHGHEDAWKEGKNLGERIRNTPGAANAIRQCTDLFYMLDQGASTEAVMQYLDEQVFKLSEQAQKAGPGEHFKHD